MRAQQGKRDTGLRAPAADRAKRANSGAGAVRTAPALESLALFRRTAGNQAVLGLLGTGGLQPKRTGGALDDERDRENGVAQTQAPSVRTRPGFPHTASCAPGDKKTVQRKSAEAAPEEEELSRSGERGAGTTEVPAGIERRIEALRGCGRPLPRETRSFMEQRFGADFSAVRVHSDAGDVDLARSVNAHAFTVGRDIVFSAGRYAPETESGKRLLAHELAHVVQQRSGALRRTGVVQRLKCSLDHLDTECAGAAGRCQAIQERYCNKKYPKPGDIKTLHQNAIRGAESQKKKYPHAGENLLHFLSASGTEMVMPVDIFKNHTETKSRLEDEHREKFIAGAEKRLRSGVLKPGAPAKMVWTGTANAFSFTSPDDLGLAVGGYTLCSKTTVSVADKGAGKYDLAFDAWTVQAFDCYNWDPGKGIGLPGADDNDLCCLENAGKGKHFRIRTDEWNNTHAPSRANEIVSP